MGGSTIAEYLHALGHERVAELAGPDDTALFRRRHRGFATTCQALGIELLSAPYRPTEPTPTEGRSAMMAVLGMDGPRPSAVFAHNDQMAVGAQESMSEHGLICPEDLSIVGFNDAPMTSHLAPPHATVRLPFEEFGRIAGQMVIADAGEPGTRVRSVLLQPELVLRESAAPPSHAHPGLAGRRRLRGTSALAGGQYPSRRRG